MPDQMNLASPTEIIQQISQILRTLPAEKLTEVQDYLLFLQSPNPWLRFAGEWGTEEEWAQFQTNIASFRQALDQQDSTIAEA